MHQTKQPRKVATSLVLEADQIEALDTEAAKAGTSLSAVVRGVVRGWMTSNARTTQEPPSSAVYVSQEVPYAPR
jgi:hypothetical protein